MKMVVDRVIASGNMVVTHVHVETAPGAPVLVFMDIYRIEGARWSSTGTSCSRFRRRR